MSRSLGSFLRLGYFLDAEAVGPTIDLGGIDNALYLGATRQDLVELGVKLFRQAIAASFRPGMHHVVPLSGGLDSRAILAGLLEHTEANGISTFTFGSPGSLDFEIGCMIARRLGTRHTAFDLTKCRFRQDELEDVSRRVGRSTILFHHWPVHEADQRFSGGTVWSGFLGDPLSGSHRPRQPAAGLGEAIRAFLGKNRFVHSADLCPDAGGLEHLIEPPAVSKATLSLEEQLDLRNRQAKFVAPLVLMEGYDYRTPFCDPRWAAFMLSVPDEFRANQGLYKSILIAAFPRAFEYPTKTNRGLPLGAGAARLFVQKAWQRLQRADRRAAAQVNYLDFDRAIRERDDLQTVVRRNVLDLDARQVLERDLGERILAAHLNQQGNHADALLTLASLEIHLKTGLLI